MEHGVLDVRAPQEKSYQRLLLSVEDGNLFSAAHGATISSSASSANEAPQEKEKEKEFLFSLHHVRRVYELRPGGRTLVVETADGKWLLRTVGDGDNAARDCKEWARVLGAWSIGEGTAVGEAAEQRRDVWDLCILHSGSYKARAQAMFLRADMEGLGLASVVVSLRPAKEKSSSMKSIREASAVVVTSCDEEEFDREAKAAAEKSMAYAEKLRRPVVLVLVAYPDEEDTDTKETDPLEQVKSHFHDALGLDPLRAEMFHYARIPPPNARDYTTSLRCINAVLAHAGFEEKMRPEHLRCAVPAVDAMVTSEIREELLKQVEHAVTRRGAVTVLFGKDQAGKSSLMQRAVNSDRVRQRFPGGIFLLQCGFLHAKNSDSFFGPAHRGMVDIHLDALQEDPTMLTKKLPEKEVMAATVRRLRGALIVLDDLQAPAVAEMFAGLMAGPKMHLLVTTTCRKKTLSKDWRSLVSKGTAVYVPSKVSKADAEEFSGMKTQIREFPVLRMTAGLDAKQMAVEGSSEDVLLKVIELAFQALSEEAREVVSCLGHFFEDGDIFAIGDVRVLLGAKTEMATMEELEERGFVKKLGPVWLPPDPRRLFLAFRLTRNALIVDFELISRKSCVDRMARNVMKRLGNTQRKNFMADSKLLFLRTSFPKAMSRLGMISEMNDTILSWTFVEDVLRWDASDSNQWALARLSDVFVEALAVGADPLGPIGWLRKMMLHLENRGAALTDHRDLAEFLWNSLAHARVDASLPQFQRFLKQLDRRRSVIRPAESGRMFAQSPYFVHAKSLPLLSHVVSTKDSGAMALAGDCEIVTAHRGSLLFQDVTQFTRGSKGLRFYLLKTVRLGKPEESERAGGNFKMVSVPRSSKSKSISDGMHAVKVHAPRRDSAARQRREKRSRKTKAKLRKEDSSIVALKRYQENLAVVCAQSVQVYALSAMREKKSKTAPWFTGRFSAPYTAGRDACVELNHAWLAVLTDAGSVLVWNLKAASSHVIPASHHVACSLTLLGSQLIVGAQDGGLVVWSMDAERFRVLRRFDRLHYPSALSALCCVSTEAARGFKPSAVLCTGGRGGNRVNVFYRMKDEEIEMEKGLAHSAAVSALNMHVTQQDAFLFVCCADCSVTIWCLSDTSHHLRHELQVHRVRTPSFGANVSAVPFYSQGEKEQQRLRTLRAQVVRVKESQVVVVVHVKSESKREKNMLEAFDLDLESDEWWSSPEASTATERMDVTHISTCRSPKGLTHVATVSTDNVVRLWHLRSGPEAYVQPVHELRGHLAEITGLAMAPFAHVKEPFLATCGADMLRIWDLESGKHLKAIAPTDVADVQIEGQEVGNQAGLIEDSSGGEEDEEDAAKTGFGAVEVVPFSVPLQGPFCSTLKPEEQVEALIVCLSMQEQMLRVYAYPCYKMLFQKYIGQYGNRPLKNQPILKCAVLPSLPEPRLNVWVALTGCLLLWDLRSPDKVRVVALHDSFGQIRRHRIAAMELSKMGDGEERRDALIVSVRQPQHSLLVLDAATGEYMQEVEYPRREPKMIGFDPAQRFMICAKTKLTSLSLWSTSSYQNLASFAPTLALAGGPKLTVLSVAMQASDKDERCHVFLGILNVGLITLTFATPVDTRSENAKVIEDGAGLLERD